MITDMANTVDRIVAASKLPLSIVIVEVGGADFKNMVSTRTLMAYMYVYLVHTCMWGSINTNVGLN